jgi:hypothetical protein
MTLPPYRLLLIPAALLAAIALGACSKHIEPPFERGVCFHVVPLTGGQVKFNVLAKNKPSLEACAASLEGMRERFLALGGTSADLVGAYNGNFLFLGRTGVFTGTTLDGARWPALVRTRDGRLAVPSAVDQ